MKTLLIGEAQPRSGLAPWDGPSGRHVERLAGLPRCSIDRWFELRNVLPAWPGHTGQGGDAFPIDRAAHKLRQIASSLGAGDSAIVASKRLAAAIGLKPPPCCWVMNDAGAFFGVLPHPSGVNRWWNSRENREKGRTFLRLAAAESWLESRGRRERHLALAAIAWRVQAYADDVQPLKVANAEAILELAIRRERGKN